MAPSRATRRASEVRAALMSWAAASAATANEQQVLRSMTAWQRPSQREVALAVAPDGQANSAQPSSQQEDTSSTGSHFTAAQRKSASPSLGKKPPGHEKLAQDSASSQHVSRSVSWSHKPVHCSDASSFDFGKK